MRSVFVDLGANSGQVSRDFAIQHPNFEIFSVEPNPTLIPHIMNSSLAAKKAFNIIWAAAWTYDGTIDFFQSGADAASTVVPGKVEINNWPQIDYSKPHIVPCFDISGWLLRSFQPTDNIVLKIDIEGAEYAILSKMINDGSIHLVRRLMCEWHQDRFPQISNDAHETLRTKLKALVSDLEEWG